MRTFIAAAAAISLIAGCGGSSSSPGVGDGGPSGSGSSGADSSDAGSNGSSSSGSGSSGAGSSGSSSGSVSSGGSCAAPSGMYALHWSIVSGGPACATTLPMDRTTAVNPDAGVSMSGTDAGACAATLNGCTYSANCDISLGDAGFEHLSEALTLNSDGSISGTLMLAYSFTFGTTTTAVSCTYSVTGTKL